MGQHAKCRTMAPQRANDLQTWCTRCCPGAAPTPPRTTRPLRSRRASWRVAGTAPARASSPDGRGGGGDVAGDRPFRGRGAGGRQGRHHAGARLVAVRGRRGGSRGSGGDGKVAGMALPRSYFSAKTSAAPRPRRPRRPPRRQEGGLVAQFVRCASGSWRWRRCCSGRQSIRRRTARAVGCRPTARRATTATATGEVVHPGGRGRSRAASDRRWQLLGGRRRDGAVGARAAVARVLLGDLWQDEGGRRCIETAHRAVLEQALAAPAVRGAATLNLDELIVDGAIDVPPRAAADRHTAQVLWGGPPSAVEAAAAQGIDGGGARRSANSCVRTPRGPHDECAWDAEGDAAEAPAAVRGYVLAWLGYFRL